MIDLLKLLKKSKYFLLFLFLESISLKIFFFYRTTQNVIFLEQIVQFTGRVNSIFTSFSDYFYLKFQNEKLSQENVQLRNLLLKLEIERNNFKNCNTDSIKLLNQVLFKEQYYVYEGKVIQNTTNLNNNYFQINKGKLHGIKKDMGVITQNGIAGIVINTSDNFSTVLSVLNKIFKVSAQVKNNNFIGYLEWDGKNIEEVVMKNYPLNSKINIGDSVVTSAYSEKFIPYSNIGIISEIITEPNKNNLTLKIKLGTKFNELDIVYIINNLLKQELQELNNSNPYQN